MGCVGYICNQNNLSQISHRCHHLRYAGVSLRPIFSNLSSRKKRNVEDLGLAVSERVLERKKGSFTTTVEYKSKAKSVPGHCGFPEPSLSVERDEA